MTATNDDLGQGGDVAVGSMILEAHRRCRDCAAGRCETGAQAKRLLTEHRAERAKLLASPAR